MVSPLITHYSLLITHHSSLIFHTLLRRVSREILFAYNNLGRGLVGSQRNDGKLKARDLFI